MKNNNLKYNTFEINLISIYYNHLNLITFKILMSQYNELNITNYKKKH